MSQATTAAGAATPGAVAVPTTAGGDAGAAARETSGGAGTAGPIGGTADAGGALDAAVTAVGVTPDQAQVAALTEWRKGEAIEKQLIASMITNSLVMKICMQLTAYEIWNTLAQEFERKSRTVSVDLRRWLQEQRCSDRDDIWAHFAKLRMMREDLAVMGQSPSDNDFFAIIMGSMPTSYEPYLSAISATSRVTGNVLSPDELMEAPMAPFLACKEC
ncbi:hypothetical protein PYCCODRAFT_1468263 [Trametes coccinea BRFM310]|uniref:Uncharacterized protein n=1 Tax=Trametes coccinea (strain BRFM310) TaxID=1353009 RepID=A0A1Y2ILI8_TRAC3|nr:hypothetical protein PYCCODRAFT_1468263 [Trametes coccinea BRFM310]